ncbi:unnamed protein product, partial [Closterium sp. NIES-54]
DLENYHKLALLHMHTGKPRQALEVAKEGLQLFPQSTNLHYLAASAHHALANFSAAARHYSTVLALGGRSQEENAQLYHNLAFYQREVAAYTHASLTHPFTEFSMDAYLHSALLEAWMRKEPHQLLPPSVVRYTTQQQLQQQQRQEEKRQQKQQQEVELSEEALAVVEKADELGPRAMYRVGGFLHDPRKLRMAGLAALDVMQRASSTWQAMLEQEEQLEQESQEEHSGGGGSRGSEDGSTEESSGKRGQGEEQEEEEEEEEEKKRKRARRGRWRDMFEAIVQWRQIADPIDSVTWIQDNKESYGSHVAATPIVDGQMDNYKYFEFHDRAFALIKDRLLTTRSAIAASGSPNIPLSASALRKVRKAAGLRELHAAVGRDFYVQLPCHSRTHPGKDIGGIQLALVHIPPGFVFAIRIGLSPQRWKDFHSEMDAAWQALGAAVVEARRVQGTARGAGTGSDSHKTHKSHMPHMAHIPVVQRQKVQRAILDLAFYWYHLSPLSRGSAMVGWISVLGLSMAAGLHTTALVPEGMQ